MTHVLMLAELPWPLVLVGVDELRLLVMLNDSLNGLPERAVIGSKLF